MNNVGYVNHAKMQGPATMCGYFNSEGQVRDPDGPVCKYNPQKDDFGKLCLHFFGPGMCMDVYGDD